MPAMPSTKTNCEFLTVGQLAKRWGVGPARVHQLVQEGHLRSFRIPSSGRYGKTIKIALDSVHRLENEEWVFVLKKSRKAGPKRQGMSTFGPALRHFPKLTA